MAQSQVFPPAELNAVLADVSKLLKSRGETVSVVETAAGGIISAAILSQPGASSIYGGGLTLYTLPSRVAYGGWTQDMISSYQGPTTEIVEHLARHVRQDLKSTYSIAESGTAGPRGGRIRNAQPGDVALAVDSDRGTISKELNTGLGGDRVGNMVRFAVEALELLREAIEQNSDSKTVDTKLS